MRGKLTQWILLMATGFGLLIAVACDKDDDDRKDKDEVYDVETHGIPQLVQCDYIELAKIQRISKFRSAEGHDYSDEFETCRSMKHYYQPIDTVNWSTIKIFSPVDGMVIRAEQEWAGTRVQIKSDDNPAFHFIIFHVNLSHSLKFGDHVQAGQQLGTHIGYETWSDIAVGVTTPLGWKLISYFEVMPDDIFQNYIGRGLTARSDVIITKDARDADPVTCNGDAFVNQGQLENWVMLN